MKENSDLSGGFPIGANAEPKIYDCVCFCVSSYEIRQLIIDNDVKTWEDLRKLIFIGEACGMCVEPIKKFLEWRNG